MIRWRLCVVLALLLLLPGRTSCKPEGEEEDEEQAEEGEEDDDDEDDEEESEQIEKIDHIAGRQQPAVIPTPKALVVTRSSKKRPLECYVCAFKAETPIRACLDPTKYRVHTMTCHNPDDKCFTSVISKGSTYEAVIRGCRSGCVGTTDITCCEINRCNNQALAVPVMPPRVAVVAAANKSNKPIPPTVLFFVTVLLVLQTVVKVAI